MEHRTLNMEHLRCQMSDASKASPLGTQSPSITCNGGLWALLTQFKAKSINYVNNYVTYLFGLLLQYL